MSSYLNELCRFYGRMTSDPASGMPPEGMTAEFISFALVLSEDGELVRVEDLRDSRGKPIRQFVPAAVKRSVNIAANFLWDNTGYVLGVDDKGKQERSKQTAESFRHLHRNMLAGCENPHAQALLTFLDKWKPEMFAGLELRESMLNSNLAFKPDGQDCFLHEIPELKARWLDALHSAGNATEKGICLVSGRQGGIALTHPSIKGVIGAQSSGAALVSFNCPSFTSYGKEQNANAPVSENAARAYTSALNYLLQREHRQMVRIGDTCMVFWADKASPAEILFGDFFDPAPSAESEQDREQIERLKGILQALRKGLPLNEADRELDTGARFYVLGLAPNAARLSVRFWLTNTLEVLLRNISRWYADLNIERQFPDSEPEFPALWLLLVRTVAAQGKSENIPPGLGGQMAHAMLSGSHLPENVFTAALQRIHADKQVGYYRATLIKAYLRRNQEEEKDMTTLNTEGQSNGYRLGRLFALLEKTQKDALGTVNAPLRERYIGAASATPRLVFPMLLRLCQHHVTKAAKNDFAGYETVFNKRMAEILGDMADFPAVLPLHEQGRFMLGYYHQTNALYQKKTNSAEAGE